jgi:tyrosinase
MGDTPKAARDPIFWLHHVNIDRLWESWRLADADGKSARDPVDNAGWRRHGKFAFAEPNGERVEMTVSDALIAAKRLNVQYDRLEDVPTTMGVAGDEERTPTTLATRAASRPVTITTEDAAVTVSLAPAADVPVSLGLANNPKTRYDLVIEVEASRQPGAAYDVFVKAAERLGSAPTERYVRTFNLFGASRHDAGHHQAIRATWKTDVTQLVHEGVIDPAAPGQVTFRARYSNPAVPVSVRSVRIQAR